MRSLSISTLTFLILIANANESQSAPHDPHTSPLTPSQSQQSPPLQKQTGPSCGDGHRDAEEFCDGIDFKDKDASCATVKGSGWSGRLLCAYNCMEYNTSDCRPPN